MGMLDNILVNGSMDMGSLIWWLFWLLFIVFPLITYLQQYSLRAARIRMLSRLERKYGMRFITMIHRQERVGILGIPVYRYIDIEDSEEILRAIRSTPDDMPIALILHTPGGLVLAAAQVAKALKKHPAKKVVIIPHYAMSGGTLIALAADEIWIDESAVLGPLDPQIGMGVNQPPLPAPSVLKVARMKGDKASDNFLVLADISEKAIREMQEIIVDILGDRYDRDKAWEIAKALTEGNWTHDYPITVDEAIKLGLNIRREVPTEVYELMALYPQAHQRRPGIEYLPLPMRPTGPDRRVD
jgi:ClpP class serine protease